MGRCTIQHRFMFSTNLSCVGLVHDCSRRLTERTLAMVCNTAFLNIDTAAESGIQFMRANFTQTIRGQSDHQADRPSNVPIFLKAECHRGRSQNHGP